MAVEITEQIDLSEATVFFRRVGLLSDQPPTIFVDRDGVINCNRPEHVLSWQDFQFEEGALEALCRLRTAGYQVIVITNQAAIERGLVSAAQIDALHDQMLDEIERHGGRVDAVLCCPHSPEARCVCRKPAPGLLLQAAQQFEVQLGQSWFIGDYLTDVQAGLSAGCKPLLVLTGRGQTALETWQQSTASQTIDLPVKRNLLEAVKFVLLNERVLA